MLHSNDASVLLSLTDSVRKSAMAALSNLSKYLGIYKKWKLLVENYGLKWSEGKTEDLVICRITKTNGNGEVLKWIYEVKVKLPELNVFMDFILVSGLRYREAVNSYNLIIDLAGEGRLNEYYDAEKEVLGHYRFKKLFIRRSKKAFISYVSKGFIERISKQEKLTRYQIDNWIRRNGLKSRFSDIREYYATYMTKHLTQPEIDFL